MFPCIHSISISSVSSAPSVVTFRTRVLSREFQNPWTKWTKLTRLCPRRVRCRPRFTDSFHFHTGQNSEFCPRQSICARYGASARRGDGIGGPREVNSRDLRVAGPLSPRSSSGEVSRAGAWVGVGGGGVSGEIRIVVAAAFRLRG